jgi:hypothetical protein
LANSKLIYGKFFLETPIATATANTTYNYPQTFSLPVTGYKILHSIQALFWYRDNDITTYLTYLKFSFLATGATTINIQVDFGLRGQLHTF